MLQLHHDLATGQSLHMQCLQRAAGGVFEGGHLSTDCGLWFAVQGQDPAFPKHQLQLYKETKEQKCGYLLCSQKERGTYYQRNHRGLETTDMSTI